MDNDAMELIKGLIRGVERLADAVEDQNKIAREDIQLIQELDIDEEFKGRKH